MAHLSTEIRTPNGSQVPSDGTMKVAQRSLAVAPVAISTTGGSRMRRDSSEASDADTDANRPLQPVQAHSASGAEVSKKLEAIVHAHSRAKDAKTKANAEAERPLPVKEQTGGVKAATTGTEPTLSSLRCPARFPHPRLARYTNNGSNRGTRIGSTALNGEVLLFDVADGSRVAVKRTPLEHTRLPRMLQAHVRDNPAKNCTCGSVLSATSSTSAAPFCVTMSLNPPDNNHTSLENAYEEVRMFQWLCEHQHQPHKDMKKVDADEEIIAGSADEETDNGRCISSNRHVIALRDSFYDERYLYAVFDLCTGGELLEYVKNVGPLPEALARHVFRQLVTGTEFIHSKGICILDISPENVLFKRPVPADASKATAVPSSPVVSPVAVAAGTETSNDGPDYSSIEVALIDLGLARWMLTPEEQQQQGKVNEKPDYTCLFPAGGRRGGKITYMAPEYFSGLAFDGCKADAFSLGVTLFVMLFGIPPFEHPTVKDRRFALVSSHRASALLKAWGMSDITSPVAVDLLQGLLCADPAKRLGLAETLAHPWMVV